jgi:hypothetical protein
MPNRQQFRMERKEWRLIASAAETLRRYGYHQDAKRLDRVVELETGQSEKYTEGYDYASWLPQAPRKRFAHYYARSDWDQPAAAYRELYPTE